MKFYILLLITTIGWTTHAEEQGSRMNLSQRYPFGMYVGAAYTNFTDYTVSTHVADGPKSVTRYSSHLAFGGIKAGYNRTYQWGLGFNAGVSALTSVNKSESSDQLTLIIPQIDLTAGVGNVLSFFAGANIGYIGGNAYYDAVTPLLGYQAGMNLAFSLKWALSLGYSLISYRVTNANSPTTENIQQGGMNTIMTYKF
jgi:hypothetical protein